MARRKKPPRRMAFHLSFHPDDPYECRLADAIKRLPRAYAKYAFINMVKEFITRAMTDDEMHSLLMDFARDVRPMRLEPPRPEVVHLQPPPLPARRRPELPAAHIPRDAPVRTTARQLVMNIPT